MDYEEKNICKKRESKIKKPERKLDSTKKNVLSDIGNNDHEMEEDCSLHPQRFKTEPNLDQKDFCGSFETHVREGEKISSSGSVWLINGKYKLNLKEKTLLMRQKKEDTKAVQQFNTFDNPNSCSAKYNFKTNIKKPQPQNNISYIISAENIDKKSKNPENKIVQTIESQKSQLNQLLKLLRI